MTAKAIIQLYNFKLYIISIAKPPNEKNFLYSAWLQRHYLSQSAIAFREFMIDYFQHENTKQHHVTSKLNGKKG